MRTFIQKHSIKPKSSVPVWAKVLVWMVFGMIVVGFLSSSSIDPTNPDAQSGETVEPKSWGAKIVCASYDNLARVQDLGPEKKVGKLEALDCVEVILGTQMRVLENPEFPDAVRVQFTLPSGVYKRGYIGKSRVTNARMEVIQRAAEAESIRKSIERDIANAKINAARVKSEEELKREEELKATEDKLIFYSYYEGEFIVNKNAPICIRSWDLEKYEKIIKEDEGWKPHCWQLLQGRKVYADKDTHDVLDISLKFFKLTPKKDTREQGFMYVRDIITDKMDADYKIFCQNKGYKYVKC